MNALSRGGMTHPSAVRHPDFTFSLSTIRGFRRHKNKLEIIDRQKYKLQKKSI
jgi:hypothetical protein